MRKWALTLAVLPLIFCACSRSRREASAAPPAAVSPRKEEETSRELALRKQEAPKPAAIQVTPGTEEQKLRPLGAGPVLPEDFKIGPLHDLLSAGREARSIYEVAETFLKGLQNGTVAKETLLKENREQLARSLGYQMEQKRLPISYRIGAISVEAGVAWMNVRLFGSPGISEGELYLTASDGKWYVSDFQISFDSLTLPYEKKQERYLPSPYGWRLP